MSWKITIAIVGLVGCALGAAFILGKGKSSAPLTVTLRIAVTPGSQADFVLARAQSAKFKYVAGKVAGLKPAFAQKLSVSKVPGTDEIGAEIGVPTKEAARLYTEGFVAALQRECGSQTKLALASQTIR